MTDDDLAIDTLRMWAERRDPEHPDMGRHNFDARCPWCRDTVHDTAKALLDEIERLRRWKAEAEVVIAGWDDVVAVVDDLPLGVPRSAGVARELARLRAEVKVLHDVLPLTPGHHHVTVRADGGWDAVPMEEQTFAPGMWEYVARCFHAHYERLAGDFGYQTRPESAVAWQNVPERNRRLMVATVGHVLRDIRDIRRLWVDAPVQGDDR